jgi:glyoxylase-like metal-dependent hydrolase (beta-lactamase superfamily II)
MKRIKAFKHPIVKGNAFGSWLFGEPSMYVYVWYIDGLLIDTGHRRMRKEILETIGDWQVDKLYVTHHHEDHSANIKVIKKHFNCQVLTSSKCAEIMKKPPSLSPAQHFMWGLADSYDNFTIENDRIETKNYSFQILPIPGHASDMVCLYEENQGWLFSADLYLHHYVKYFMRSESMRESIKSLAKVKALDFDTMFCAHNPQLDNPKALLQRKQQFFEDFYGNVIERHDKGMSEKEIFTDMGLHEAGRIKWMSLGALSGLNMVRSVLRDESL